MEVHSEGGQLRTLANLCSPSRCSSSTLDPRAFAITALRPRNIRAVLIGHYMMTNRRARMSLTLSKDFGQFLNEHCALRQPQKANSISIFLCCFEPFCSYISASIEDNRSQIHLSHQNTFLFLSLLCDLGQRH